jgi:hypothetical protein
MNTPDASKTTPKIIARIQKLMALAKNNPNEHEAEAAANQVQALLAEHNLEMASIEASGAANAGDSGAERVKEQSNGKAMYKWQRDLMAAVASLNYCYHSVGHTGKYNKAGIWMRSPFHFIVGRQVNVLSARLMFDYLTETIEKLVPIANNAQRLSKSAMSWKEGCVARLIERLNDKRWEREQAAARAERAQAAAAASGGSTSTALTLASMTKGEDDANWELANGYKPGDLAKWRAERAAERAAAPPVVYVEPKLTEKQREAQEAKWRRQDERARAKQEREWANKDMAAYRAGSRVGGTIGLDTQVDGAEQRKLS